MSRPSSSAIPFKQAFKGSSDRRMQADPQSGASEDHDGDDFNMKKHQEATTPGDKEEEDIELSEKKDRPPRFSTLFAGAPVPVPMERDARRDKKSGVFLPMPVFIVLVLILFFESTLLFAYTIIGLYNNRPAGLLPGRPAPIGDFNNCASKPAGIHIAPNFVMAQPTQPTVTVTVTLSTTYTKKIAAKTTSSVNEAQVEASMVKSILSTALPKTTTSSVNEAKAEASMVKSILETLLPKTTTSTTATNPNIATRTTLIEVGANGKPLPLVTIHSTKTVKGRGVAVTTVADDGHEGN